MKIDKIVSYVLLIVVVIAVAAVVYITLNPSPGETFTEFYILGPDGKAGDYPTNLTVGEEGKVIIGIVNHEGNTANYEVVIRLNDIILKNETFKLENNEEKRIPFTFNSNQSGNGQKVEFFLYKLPDNQQPYRSLDLLVDVINPETPEESQNEG
jgi:uncharacterized membrane protein